MDENSLWFKSDVGQKGGVIFSVVCVLHYWGIVGLSTNIQTATPIRISSLTQRGPNSEHLNLVPASTFS